MTHQALTGTRTESLTRPADPRGPAGSRRTLPPRVAYWHAAAVIGLCLFASVVPSPLYHTYALAWHFSPLTLTLVYATYAFGVLAALLLAGRVSDQVGRRPVLLVALAALMVSSALFIAAGATWWLFVARGVQGLATGTALSAASAALLDLHARRDPVSAGLANAVASCAGLGLGVLVSAVLVQAGTAPRTLPYVTLLVLLGTALAGAYWMPEPVRERTAFRLTPQRPGVPAGHPPSVPDRLPRGALLLVDRRPVLLHRSRALGAPVRVGQRDHRGAGRHPAHPDGSAGPAGVPPDRAVAGRDLRLGRAGRGDGADRDRDGRGLQRLVRGRLVVAGAGFGVAFLGGLRQLTGVIPAEHRAAVMSAFYLVGYASLSVPAVLAGLVVTHLGLETTFEIFGCVVAGVALVMAAEAWRMRPGR